MSQSKNRLKKLLNFHSNTLLSLSNSVLSLAKVSCSMVLQDVAKQWWLRQSPLNLNSTFWQSKDPSFSANTWDNLNQQSATSSKEQELAVLVSSFLMKSMLLHLKDLESIFFFIQYLGFRKSALSIIELDGRNRRTQRSSYCGSNQSTLDTW